MTIKPFRSIKRKLTMNLVIAFTAIILMVLVVTGIAGKYAYDSFMYNQLKEVARLKKQIPHSGDRSKDSLEDEALIQSSIWVAHFSVIQKNDGVNLKLDAFTERLFIMRDEEVIYKMAELVGSSLDDFGKIHEDNLTYFYYFDRNNKSNYTMIYYLADQKGGFPLINYALAVIMIVVIIPVAYRFSGAIVNPILELEMFAEDVAKRNWSARTPVTENDEVGMLARALDRMKDALKQAEERDRRFLQAASHDLKTPIMIIKGYAQAQIDGVNTESEQDTSEIIREEAAKLERRVKQLMHINTLGHTLGYEDRWSEIRMDRMLRSLTERFRVVRNDIQWIVDLEEVEVFGDSDALLIALENICENQIRFADKRIYIMLTCEDKYGTIKISNDGPRFEIEDPSTLFDPYRKDLEGQFGLGLSIVRQVVEGHNGTVSAISLTDGVQFEIRIPITSC